MWIVAGLGNPGRRYAATRHNIGFRVLDVLASRAKIDWEGWQGLAKIGSWSRGGVEILLVKPQTYMNRSGVALGRILEAHGEPVESLVVVHDDMDLPFERLRLKRGGGSGGHKGIESILHEVGSDRFVRLKMGIGRPGTGEAPEGYVLSKFSEDESERVGDFVARGADALECVFEDGLDRAMNLFNVRPREEAGGESS